MTWSDNNSQTNDKGVNFAAFATDNSGTDPIIQYIVDPLSEF